MANEGCGTSPAHHISHRANSAETIAFFPDHSAIAPSWLWGEGGEDSGNGAMGQSLITRGGAGYGVVIADGGTGGTDDGAHHTLTA